MATASSSEEPRGYLLLTLNDVKVDRLYEGQRMPIASGELRLECISLPIDPSIGHQRANPFADSSDPTVDLWLVLQVGTYETTLLPTLQMSVGVSPAGGRELTIPSDSTVVPPSAGAVNGIVLTLPAGSIQDEQEDIQTFEVLLRQYGCLTSEQLPEVKAQAAVASSSSKDLTGLAKQAEEAPRASVAATATSPTGSSSLAPHALLARPGLNRAPSTQGRLVLVDTNSGQVVGELSEQLPMKEEQALLDGGDTKSPVIVDFGEIEYSGVVKHVDVRTVDAEDMDDWILKGAHYLSKGILSISGASQTAINSAAEFYIAHSDKYVEPTKFSPATKSGIRQVHNVSAKGYKVTKKTLGMVNDAITKYAGPVIDNSLEGAYNLKEAVKADLPEAITKRRVSMDVFRSEEEKKEPAKPKKPFISRLIQAGEVVLTSIEAAGQDLINTSTDASSSVAGHKFGPEAAQATQLLGGSVRNVALVYVDVSGVGRQALLKSAGKGFVMTTLKSGNKVRLMAHDAKNGQAAQMTMADGEVVQPVVTVTSDESPGTTTPVSGLATPSGYPQEKALYKKAE